MNYLFQKSNDSVAHGIKVFRGVTIGEQPIKVGFKPDWRLIPKVEEDKFKNFSRELPEVAVPKTATFPPLLEKFILAERHEAGIEDLEPPKLELIARDNKFRNVKYV